MSQEPDERPPLIYKSECEKQDYTDEMINYLVDKLKQISIDAVQKVETDIKNGKQEIRYQ